MVFLLMEAYGRELINVGGNSNCGWLTISLLLRVAKGNETHREIREKREPSAMAFKQIVRSCGEVQGKDRETLEQRDL